MSISVAYHTASVLTPTCFSVSLCSLYFVLVCFLVSLEQRFAAMSKFFANNSSDEESSEHSSDENSDSGVDAKQDMKGGQFKFDSSESDEEKRVVRSAKDKKWEVLTSIIKAMKNHIKINDWVSIAKDFDALVKGLEKAANVVAKEGVPSFFFKAILFLEKTLEDTFGDKDLKKKMNALNAKVC